VDLAPSCWVGKTALCVFVEKLTQAAIQKPKAADIICGLAIAD
jgi:hypothetical protein